MRSIRTGLLVAVALVIGLAATSARASTANLRPVPFQRGVTIADWGPNAYGSPGFGKLVQSLKRRGVDTVTLLVVWEQDDQTSTDITPGGETVPAANLVAAIQTARAAHLRVILKPYIDLRNGRWRGLIAPSSVPQWFASYDAYILRFARLAQKEDVQGFVVGTEMQSMQKYAGDWRALVRQVRQVFRTGFVTYQANHNALTEHNISWWDAVDVIDISAYWTLNRDGAYDVPDLVSGWSRWSSLLGRLHRKYHRDIMFGEIGYTPYTGTFAQPWVITPLGTYSPTAQANGYTAAFDVWYPVKFFKGMNFWYFSSNPGLRKTDSGNDEPRYPAIKVLRYWYRNKKPAG
ncbi:MAG TPA: hypothetical protein VFC51_10585 [Chloroflexota bacterium]|nr:hypothetical protein [Chloroflexota bacterium]